MSISNHLDSHALIKDFNKGIFNNESDVQIQFYATIIKPILEVFAPNLVGLYDNEPRFIKGGRADAVFQNLAFEIKSYNKFETLNGIKEALEGRNERDSGLYEYIFELAQLTANDTTDDMVKKLTSQVGIGFDGKQFLFARFAKSHDNHILPITKGSFAKITSQLELPLVFVYDKFDIQTGIERLKLLFRQRNKIVLNKANLIKIINPQNPIIQENIASIYTTLDTDFDSNNPNNRIITLYNEWDRVFGVLYGDEQEQTAFTQYATSIKTLYKIENDKDISVKKYLFCLQTYFNIFIKLLIHNFLKELINPSFEQEKILEKLSLNDLFEGKKKGNSLVANFFEIHFYEWFTYSESFNMDVISSTIDLLNQFEVASYLLKPETMQDILQEVYMGLIPKELRHLMGEYFTPDWAVEFVLKNVGFDGDINKRLVDPTCGSGAFLLQAIKSIVNTTDLDDYQKVQTLVNNVVGFDINPISAVSAKANYILALFSNLKMDIALVKQNPINIPIYISDSVLTPVVYSEQNSNELVIKTHLGDFTLPKFSHQNIAHQYLDMLSDAVLKADITNYRQANAVFLAKIKQLGVTDNKEITLSQTLFDRLCELHRASKNSFWGKIFKNNFAPIMIDDKFDYVVGNPPWISWKSMSKTYRTGTLEVWQSYGIFEKNAYDKKTTHDDFGMAVTYVAVDYYLKEGGKLGFLLPASFIKSSKGGHGFRKFKIVRKGQDIPFSVYRLDDFSNIKLFTIPSMAIFFEKGKQMVYPMDNYHNWDYLATKKTVFDSHAKWSDVSRMIDSQVLSANPVSSVDLQSSWLTLEDDKLTLSKKVLDMDKERFYHGRKGIEPAGAKGVYVLKKPVACNPMQNGKAVIVNDISRQRRQDILNKGEHKGVVETDLIYPMLGGRNIQRWYVSSNEYILVPHSKEHKYGIPETELLQTHPLTYNWLEFYQKELFDSRVQNGKFFNPNKNPFYRLDNVGEYTYAPYKVLWKEQTGSMSAVVVGNAEESLINYDNSVLGTDKIIMVDSKVLYLALESVDEAYFVCGIINSPTIRNIIDGYAVETNRGTDVLKYLAIPKYDDTSQTHKDIARISEQIHDFCKIELKNLDKIDQSKLSALESALDTLVIAMFA